MEEDPEDIIPISFITPCLSILPFVLAHMPSLPPFRPCWLLVERRRDRDRQTERGGSLAKAKVDWLPDDDIFDCTIYRALSLMLLLLLCMLSLLALAAVMNLLETPTVVYLTKVRQNHKQQKSLLFTCVMRRKICMDCQSDIRVAR